jgi:hypothetical protein
MTTPRSFRELEQVSVSHLRGAEWDAYYAELATWLGSADADIQKRAINRLFGAAFWAEGHAASQALREQALREQGKPEHEGPPPWQPYDNSARMSWLLSVFDAAHIQHNDVIPMVIREMLTGSVTGPDDPIMLWLERLRETPPPGVDPGLIEGAIVLKQPFDEDDPADVARLVALLDHPSDLVRACAAHCMTGRSGDALDAAAMFALIKEKEIIRPGIAGPYSAEWVWSDNIPVDPIAWMMDILERRSGPEPDDMPFTGIDFYLHEICASSPEAVQRMIRGGHFELAIETATEHLEHIPGMEPVLFELADHPASAIRQKAQSHLAQYYRVLHPEAERLGIIRRWPDWSPDADVFSFHHGEERKLWFITIYPPDASKPFSDAAAWTLIDQALPPDLRGALDFPIMDYAKVPPPAPYRLRDMMMWRFTSGASVDLRGDPDTKTWTRINIIGTHLGERWKPFSD